jgi:flagellum-specific ATP synthase
VVDGTLDKRWRSAVAKLGLESSWEVTPWCRLSPGNAWADYLEVRLRPACRYDSTLEVRGTLTRLTGLVLEASGIRVPVGHSAMVSMPAPPGAGRGGGFSQDRAFLMPAGDVHGLSSGASVVPASGAYVPVPRLGERPRIPLNADAGAAPAAGQRIARPRGGCAGCPMDRMGPITDIVARWPLDRRKINAMDRAPVRQPLDTGVRAINALADRGAWAAALVCLRVGRGQKRVAGHDGPLHQADVIVVG